MSNVDIILRIILNLFMLGIVFFQVYLAIKHEAYLVFISALASFALFTIWTYDFIKQLYGLT